ncbi:hypothetical protein ACFYZE_10190 [Streptomyces sp. NPDC001796]|uniref:hypothetical protein n=1 Tax=Streptomyces sp. NPDC001796 TaxID=3364609 RepID=UPI00369502AA
MFELADALKIVAMRSHFDDLDLALRYVGCVRSTEPSEVVPPADIPPVGADELDYPEFEDSVPRSAAADGWAQLSEAELEEVAREAKAGEDGGRRRQRHRSGPNDTKAYVIPLVLEPTEEQEQPAPAYTSVAPPRPASRSRSTAARSAINPRTGKATMHALLKRSAESAEIDVDAVVQRLALALPVNVAPRVKRNLTVPPMHLLYDTSLLIGPYADDVRHLVGLARSLFDADYLEVRAYRNTIRGGCGSGPVWTWGPFRFPRVPATVVFITGSFGGDLTARVRELQEIVSELERKGHHACVLWLGEPPRPAEGTLRSWRMIRT